MVDPPPVPRCSANLAAFLPAQYGTVPAQYRVTVEQEAGTSVSVKFQVNSWCELEETSCRFESNCVGGNLIDCRKQDMSCSHIHVQSVQFWDIQEDSRQKFQQNLKVDK